MIACIFLVELLGVLVEFGGKISVIYRGGAFDGGFIDIYEELIVERFAAEEDRKVVATTISQSKADAYALALDNGGKGQHDNGYECRRWSCGHAEPCIHRQRDVHR